MGREGAADGNGTGSSILRTSTFDKLTFCKAAGKGRYKMLQLCPKFDIDKENMLRCQL